MSVDELYELELDGQYAVVAFLPLMNEVPWSDIEEVGTRILESTQDIKQPAVLVDLTQLNHMGSAMVALIVRVWKSSNEQQGKMAVVSSDPHVYEVLKISGLADVWTIVESRDEAEKSLGIRRRSTTGAAGSNATHGSLWPGLLSLLLAILAGAGLYLVLRTPESITEKTAQGVALGFSALALLAGMATALKCHGAGRLLGIITVLSGIGVGAAVFLNQ